MSVPNPQRMPLACTVSMSASPEPRKRLDVGQKAMALLVSLISSHSTSCMWTQCANTLLGPVCVCVCVCCVCIVCVCVHCVCCVCVVCVCVCASQPMLSIDTQVRITSVCLCVFVCVCAYTSQPMLVIDTQVRFTIVNLFCERDLSHVLVQMRLHIHPFMLRIELPGERQLLGRR